LPENLKILVVFLHGRSACGGQDSDERAGRPILIRPPMASEAIKNSGKIY
jgi:hypothetical protein